MTQFIIHIGPAKTGSGYLQESFAAMRRQLAERGTLYPPIWGERHHDELPGRLARLDPTLEQPFTELRECGYPAVLLSHPGLVDLSAASVEYLRTLMRRSNPARIVFYVRSWAALLTSHWKQAVMSGGTRTLREFLLEWIADPSASPIVNFAPALRNYAAAFGAYAIDLVSYDAVLQADGDLFRHFAARFLDWPDAPAPELRPQNVSPDAATIEVVRALHALSTARLGRPPPREQARAMAGRYLEQADTFAAPALRRALASHAATVPFDEIDVHLAQLHRDLYNEFREAMVEPRSPGVLFLPRRVEIPYIQRDFLLAPGVAGELRRIHEHVFAGESRAVTQFIVHIGPHKTGTTYLQECFARSRPLLAARGIHYPATWGPVAHHALCDALRMIPNPKLEAQFEALHAAGHAKVLLSAEGLAGLPEAAVGYFRTLVGADNPLRCAFYVRAWSEILPSHWRESVKAGETALLPEYLYVRLHNPVVSFFVNFGVGLRNWAKHFGADAIGVVAYNQLVSQKLDLFRHFAEHFLDWPQAPDPPLEAANVSAGMADTEAIRAIAALERMRVGTVLAHRYAGALAEGYMRRKAELVPPRIAAALEAHTTRLFINEAIPALTALHRDLMAEFGGALVRPRLPNYFFRPRRAEIRYVHSDWLLVEGVLRDLQEIRQALRTEVEATGRRPEGP